MASDVDALLKENRQAATSKHTVSVRAVAFSSKDKILARGSLPIRTGRRASTSRQFGKCRRADLKRDFEVGDAADIASVTRG
jgi:hypothetical protein